MSSLKNTISPDDLSDVGQPILEDKNEHRTDSMDFKSPKLGSKRNQDITSHYGSIKHPNMETSDMGDQIVS